MRVLVISGIWPPDLGGPATHAPELAGLLAAHGHDVVVLTTASAAPEPREYPVEWVRRSLPPGIRHLAVAARVAQLSRRADVVYATSMAGRSAFAARAPLVIKVAGDPAYERSRRHGLYGGTLAEFQGARAGVRAEALRRWRTHTMRRAAHVVCPSDFLRSIVVGWGIPHERVSVLPNARPAIPPLPPRDELRRSFGMTGATLVFVGRLTAAKALEVAFGAVEQLEGVSLLVVGDGELRSDLERRAGPSVRFLGAQPRERILELFAAADAALLSSAWENFPHALVEALAVGTPAIATRVGGVPEIVHDGENGLLVPPGDPAALAAAIGRYLGDEALREQLRRNAAASVADLAPERIYARLEEILARTLSA